MNATMLSDKEYRLISQLVYEKFGINLTEQKRTLIVERLQKTLRLGNFNTFKDYYDYVISDISGQALLHLVDKLSTNHTYFFREKEHYSFLQTKVLPELIQKQRSSNSKKIRIWSAGCSSGEEAYTLAMVLKNCLGFDFPQWDIGILATDISTSVLEKALAGIYMEGQLAYVPPDFKRRYFKPNEDGSWTVNDDIKKMVMFRRLNLMNEEFPFKGLFDIVFCRNVMIYFDNQTRESLIHRLYRFIMPYGYFFIGHSESLNRENNLFKYIKPAIYQKI